MTFLLLASYYLWLNRSLIPDGVIFAVLYRDFPSGRRRASFILIPLAQSAVLLFGSGQ